MPSPSPTSLSSLPNELLIQIASHLSNNVPSVVKFAHEPTNSLVDSTETPLKDLSLVSRRWRKLTLPILFHHTRIPIDKNPQWVPIDARILDNMQSQLSTLSAHELQVYARMHSKIKSSSYHAYEERFDELLINLCRIEDDDAFLKQIPNILWFPHLPSKRFAQFIAFLEKEGLKSAVKSIVLHTDKEYELGHVPTADAHLGTAVREIWDRIFHECGEGLRRVVVAAPPCTLAGLLDVAMMNNDAWAFDMRMHYVEFVDRRLESKSKIHHNGLSCHSGNWPLVYRRPWTHLSYNEGSSVSAYSTYEYHLKQSPKMLYLILLRLAKHVDPCCNITSFAFTGIFPFTSNITDLTKVVAKIPSLNKISFQLAPGPENTLMTDKKRMGRAQPSDLWLEWNGCYKSIMAFLGTFEWKEGARFVSADSLVDEVALRNDVEEYVGTLQRRGLGWRAEGEGVWVRDMALDRDVEPSGGGTGGVIVSVPVHVP